MPWIRSGGEERFAMTPPPPEGTPEAHGLRWYWRNVADMFRVHKICRRKTCRRNGACSTAEVACMREQEEVFHEIIYPAWRAYYLNPENIGDPVVAAIAARRSAVGYDPEVKPMKKTTAAPAKAESPSKLIDGRIRELGDWRGKMLARLRALIKQADPKVEEAWKWRGVPVWEHDGIICTGESYKSVVKLTFFRGAALPDPAGLFNSSLEGNARRAIDFHEDDTVDEAAFKALIRAAVELNGEKKK